MTPDDTYRNAGRPTRDRSLAQARALLKAHRERCCRHGVLPEHCADCRTAKRREPDDEQLECSPCANGEHEHCTDDGRYGSTNACECARSTHGPNGIGVKP